MLRISKCLSKQGNRDNKELTCIEHSISIDPNRPEAYYIMSLYYSYREKFLKSYMFACIGLENLSDKKLIKDIGYFHKYQLLFQKAYSGYNKGKRLFSNLNFSYFSNISLKHFLIIYLLILRFLSLEIFININYYFIKHIQDIIKVKLMNQNKFIMTY